MIGEQLGERVHRGLPGLGRGRPLSLLLESLGLGALRKDAVPRVAGNGGGAAFGEFVRTSELRVAYVAVAGEEIRLAIDGLVEPRGRLGELALGEKLFGGRFEVAPLLPKRSRLEPTEAGVQPRAASGLRQA